MEGYIEAPESLLSYHGETTPELRAEFKAVFRSIYDIIVLSPEVHGPRITLLIN